MSCLIIAEVGVNHNGNMETAKKLIHAAARAGADVVKFQTYRVQDMIHGDREMLAKYQLTEAAHEVLQRECLACGVRFASTPFGLWAVGFLAQFKMPFWKVPSGEMTNVPYLHAIAAAGGRVLLSTGMADMQEVIWAASCLWQSDVTLLQCTTQYPAPASSANLRAMLAIGHGYGYSDHTEGIEIAIAAVALGACVIEKHLTLNRRAKGPDHKASVEPGEFTRMVKSIRNVEEAMGDGVKRPTEYELSVRDSIRNRFK